MRQEIIIVEENLIMILDPNWVDEKVRKFWEIRQREILRSWLSLIGMMGDRASASFSGDNGGDGSNGVA